MRERRLVYAPAAQSDLVEIHAFIATVSSDEIASGYIDRIEAYCATFALAAARGALRDDLLPGLRIVGFERRITIAYRLDDETVTFLRFFYGGQDWENAFE